MSKSKTAKTRVYISFAWYAVFDGSSYYAVLGMDVADILREDLDTEVVGGPYTRAKVDQVIEQLNYII